MAPANVVYKDNFDDGLIILLSKSTELLCHYAETILATTLCRRRCMTVALAKVDAAENKISANTKQYH